MPFFNPLLPRNFVYHRILLAAPTTPLRSSATNFNALHPAAILTAFSYHASHSLQPHFTRTYPNLCPYPRCIAPPPFRLTFPTATLHTHRPLQPLPPNAFFTSSPHLRYPMNLFSSSARTHPPPPCSTFHVTSDRPLPCVHLAPHPHSLTPPFSCGLHRLPLPTLHATSDRPLPRARSSCPFSFIHPTPKSTPLRPNNHAYSQMPFLNPLLPRNFAY